MFRCRSDFDKASRGKRSIPLGSLWVANKTAEFKKCYFGSGEKFCLGLLKNKRRKTTQDAFCRGEESASRREPAY